MSVKSRGFSVLVVLGAAGCVSSSATEASGDHDIVTYEFPKARAEVEARIRTMDQLDRTLESLRALHLESPKFSQLDIERGRTEFDQMLSEEFSFVSSLQDLSIEWRDLKIDVFGDVAVATSLPHFTMTDENGATSQLDLVSTLVWVKTADGWKIAHENNNQIQPK